MRRRDFLTLAAGSPALLRAQTAQQRGRDIAEKTIYALGGDGFRFMRTRTEIGKAYTFYREQITGLSPAHIYTRYVDTGDIREEQRQVFGKKQDDAVILTGAGAWEVTYRGAKALPAERLKQFRDTALHDIFYILRARRDEPGLVFEFKENDVVENAPVAVLEIYDADNRNVTAWIHSSTFLPVRQRFTYWDPIVSDRREEVTHFTKYRDAGNGVMWPHDIQRERDGMKILELYSDKVTVGDEFKPGMFDRPAGVK
jgi:hypothetical protein